ncbi:MAG: Gfo/Idh/MocA family protein, partial [Planctomycetaceae bacterium]
MSRKFNVAMIGLCFGAEFIPIYQAHPNAHVAAICRRTPDELQKCGDQFGIDKRYTSYDEVLADKDIDFVHINSPIPD